MTDEELPKQKTLSCDSLMKNYLNKKTVSCDSLVRNTSVYCITFQGWDLPAAVKLLMSVTPHVLWSGQRSASAFSLLRLRGRHTTLPITTQTFMCKARFKATQPTCVQRHKNNQYAEEGWGAAFWDRNELGGTVSGVFHRSFQDVRGTQDELFPDKQQLG